MANFNQQGQTVLHQHNVDDQLDRLNELLEEMEGIKEARDTLIKRTAAVEAEIVKISDFMRGRI